jgi:hypothetical protein
MRLAAALVALVASSALAQGTPPAPAKPADAKPADAKPAEGKPGENSTLTVRCTDDCSVRVDGKGGLRKASNIWEFKDVPSGQRRIEVSGGFLNRPLYNGYAEIPGGMQVTAQVDSNKRLTITERIPLGEQKVEKAAVGGPSTLTIRCTKNCTISIDGVRKGANQAQLVSIRDVPSGDHDIEAKFVLGTKMVRSKVTVPADSEVFITATESGLNVTNTKPLAK